MLLPYYFGIAIALLSAVMNSKLYKRRTPEKSTLYKIVYNHFQEYENIYPDKYEQDFGFLRKIVPKTIYKYLDCGILEHGYARIRCPQCGNDFFVAFSCKTRFLCPSCAEKRTLIWAAWIKDNVLQNIPHRQWVFTIPKVLRKLFHRDRTLLAQLARSAGDAIYELFRAIFPLKSYKPGFILSIQTFGDLLTWHPHIHCLVTDGVFDSTGNFHPLSHFDPSKAHIIFREKVFAMLKHHNRISDVLIDKMRSWHHSGFSVHTDVSIQKNDNLALLNLAQYIIHPSFSPHKINYIENSNSVIYTSSMHSGKKRNFEILPVIEFLHRICLHIPNPYESLIRYYGYYSNANRGKRKNISRDKPTETSLINDAPDRSSCRMTWARLIYQIYEVDPLICSSCGSTMKIISFITDRQQIINILQHLDLWPIRYPQKPPSESRASPLPFPHFPHNPFSFII